MQLQTTVDDRSVSEYDPSEEYEGNESTLHLPTSTQPDESWYHGAMVGVESPGLNEHVAYPDLHCFTPDHEVVTPNGIKNITDFEEGDSIYTLNPRTLECVEDTVVSTHNYPNSYGEVHTVSATSYDFSVTENHRFYTAPANAGKVDELTTDDYVWNTIDSINSTRRFFPNHGRIDGKQPDTFDLAGNMESGYVAVYYEDDMKGLYHKLPTEVQESKINVQGSAEDIGIERRVGKYLIPIEVYQDHREVIDRESDDVYLKSSKQSRHAKKHLPMKPWLSMIGWFISEGYADDYSNGKVKIANENQEHLDEIEQLCIELGFSYSRYERCVSFYNATVHDWLENNCGEDSYEKTIPKFIFNLSGKYCDIVLDSLIKGDGSDDKANARYYWTSSPQLGKDVVHLAVRCGEKPTLKERDGERVGEYRVTLGQRGSMYKSRQGKVESYEGNVYCVTAKKNHIILAGRDKKFEWVGQSMYPSIMLTLNVSPDTLVGTRNDLHESEYDEDDCVHGYIDTRDVKRCEGHEDWNNYTDPETNKAVMTRDSDGNWEKEWSPDPRPVKCYYINSNIKEGFVTELINDFMERKEETKGTDLYASTKAILNSIYGVFGWASNTNAFRLFDSYLAETVSLTGRKVLQYTMGEVVEYSKREYNTDAYITHMDTDGCGVAYDVDGQDQALEIAQSATDYLKSDGYPQFLIENCGYTSDLTDRHELDADVEYYAPRIYNHDAKKRYAVHTAWDEGEQVDEIDITGFEAIRSDVSDVTVDVQEQVFDFILRHNIHDVKDDVYEYVGELIEDVENGNIAVEKLGVRGGIGQPLSEYGTENRRPSTIYRGAKYADAHIDGENLGEGSKPLLYPVEYVMDDDLPKRYSAATAEDGDAVDAVAVENPNGITDLVQLDFDEIATKQIADRVRPIFENVDELSWTEMKTGHAETSLDAYM